MEPQLIRSMSHDAALSVASSAFNFQHPPVSVGCHTRRNAWSWPIFRHADTIAAWLHQGSQENPLAFPGQTCTLRRVELYHLEIRKDWNSASTRKCRKKTRALPSSQKTMCLQAIHCHDSDLSACAFGELYMVPRSDDTLQRAKPAVRPSLLPLEGLKLGEWDIFPQLSQCLNVPRTAVWVTRIKLFVF